MVEMQSMREKLVQVFDELQIDDDGVPHADMRAVEQRVCGANHCAFGAGLCTSWKFPQSLGLVAGWHHNPMGLPSGSRTLTSIVCVADRIAAQCGFGFRADLTSIEQDPQVLTELGLDDEQVAAIAERLPELFEEVEATFG